MLEESENVPATAYDAVQFVGWRLERVHGHQVGDGRVDQLTDNHIDLVNAAGQVLRVDPVQLPNPALDLSVLLLVIDRRRAKEDSVWN